ncbi:MAG: CoA transferase, partial [Reyranellaceae bacterium]
QSPNEMPRRPMNGPERTKTGYVMPAVASEKTYQGLCLAAGRPDWITDPRFAKYGDRRNNWGIYVDELEKWSTQLPVEDVMAAFEANGVPASRYRPIAEVMQDPQTAHRQALQPVADAGGTLNVMAAPFRMSAANTDVRGFCSDLGQHTDEVLRSFGLADSEIGALAD